MRKLKKVLISIVTPIIALTTLISPVSAAAPKEVASCKYDIFYTDNGDLFDPVYYFKANPDVDAAFGLKEGISNESYKLLYQHYTNNGKAEGRLPYKIAKDDTVEYSKKPVEFTPYNPKRNSLTPAKDSTFKITDGVYTNHGSKGEGTFGNQSEKIYVYDGGNALFVVSKKLTFHYSHHPACDQYESTFYSEDGKYRLVTFCGGVIITPIDQTRFNTMTNYYENKGQEYVSHVYRSLLGYGY